ncbi:hypothetical protein LDENG_00241450, partial [Lucifuga dentata]
LDSLSSALQDCVDDHIKQTQTSLSSFRQSVHLRLDQLRHKTTRLLHSFKLFSEGGDFAPEEVQLFQRRLKEETRRISVMEESVHADLEAFESKSLQQVKEVSGRLEEKLSCLMVELKFMEKIQKIFSKTQIQLKAEAACSHQQESVITSRMDELRKMTENTQVSADQVFSLLSLVSEDLVSRCQYLDCLSDSSLVLPVPRVPLQGSFAVAARPKPRKQEREAPPSSLLQASTVGVALSDDAAVGVAKSTNSRSRRFQVFGSEADQNEDSFSSTVDGVLQTSCDVLLQVAEDFYRSDRTIVSRFHFLPHNLDQWAESMMQRLLGYQEQSKNFQTTSRQKFSDQLSVLEELLCILPEVVISNYEQQQWAGLKEEVDGVRQRLRETMAASETEKSGVLAALRASLCHDELQLLNHRDQLRQQRLHSAICCSHQQLQECLRVRGAEFVTSLAALTEKLLFQLDKLLTPAETVLQQLSPRSEDCAVTMETGSAGQQPCGGNRTWPGISFLSPPSDSIAALPSSVTTVTTSITTVKSTLGHLAVIEQRDATVKRLEQLLHSELFPCQQILLIRGDESEPPVQQVRKRSG